jgi:hypothetical protein
VIDMGYLKFVNVDEAKVVARTLFGNNVGDMVETVLDLTATYSGNLYSQDMTIDNESLRNIPEEDLRRIVKNNIANTMAKQIYDLPDIEKSEREDFNRTTYIGRVIILSPKPDCELKIPKEPEKD